jgi:hypothetical protein
MNARMKILTFHINARGKMFFWTWSLIFPIFFHQSLTNTHNSVRNELFLKFNLNDLKIKTFDEFIIDPLSSNFRKQE